MFCFISESEGIKLEILKLSQYVKPIILSFMQSNAKLHNLQTDVNYKDHISFIYFQKEKVISTNEIIYNVSRFKINLEINGIIQIFDTRSDFLFSNLPIFGIYNRHSFFSWHYLQLFHTLGFFPQVSSQYPGTYPIYIYIYIYIIIKNDRQGFRVFYYLFHIHMWDDATVDVSCLVIVLNLWCCILSAHTFELCWS